MADILLVDDDRLIIKLYQLILASPEFSLTVAVNGVEMLQSVENKKPDIILLDVVLPDASGLDLCTRIKSDPRFEGTKIILVSGQEISPVQIAEGIEMGADDYLIKPFHPKELLARVKSCVKLQKTEEALREKNRELKNLYNHLQNLREKERKILAQEVQEELGQITAVLKMDIDWLALRMVDAPPENRERIRKASTTTKQIIDQIRSIATDLRPSMLDELGLYASLESYCRKIKNKHGIDCVFEHDDKEDTLSVEVSTAVFRICQEALLNVTQHASATAIQVKVQIQEKTLSLSIRDNGIGFDVVNQKGVLGLVSMRERALSVNGQLQIESVIGNGTIVTFHIPLS